MGEWHWWRARSLWLTGYIMYEASAKSRSRQIYGYTDRSFVSPTALEAMATPL